MFDCPVNASGRALLNPLHSVRAIKEKLSARKVALFRFIPSMKSVGHVPSVCVCVCVCKDMGSVIILVFAF